MSTTRLLLLGAVRIFQPVHGYLISRELVSWNVGAWGNVNPGSIYSGLRTLVRQGFLEELAAPDSVDPTAYRLTPDGENEYFRLLGEALWEPTPGDPTRLLAGLCFMTSLPRTEVREAMRARAARLQAIISGSGFQMSRLEQARTAPAHTVELFVAARRRLEGELRWAQEFGQRIERGHYRFAGEPGAADGPAPDGTWPGPLPEPESF